MVHNDCVKGASEFTRIDVHTDDCHDNAQFIYGEREVLSFFYTAWSLISPDK
jgi:hypothetical protein